MPWSDGYRSGDEVTGGGQVGPTDDDPRGSVESDDGCSTTRIRTDLAG